MLGAVFLVLTVMFSSQLALAGGMSWTGAIHQEVCFWGAWWILAIVVFEFCDWLHAGPRGRFAIAGSLVVAAVAAMLLQTLIFGTLERFLDWAGWRTSPAPRGPFLASWRGAFTSQIGGGLVLYAGLLAGWHALFSYRALQQRRVQAAELQALVREAELQALRSQLNPHFLFNSLHSIAEVVHENPRLGEDLILRLAELLRAALQSSQSQTVALADEIGFVKSYLEIERLRMGDRLLVTWDIDPATLAAPIPTLLLQPLVENAIRHGIAPSPDAGHLAIRSRVVRDRIEICIHDNGRGLAEPDRVSRGVGLANTRKRLERLYGENQRLDLINDQGMRVVVQLPNSHPAGGRSYAG